MGTNAEQINAQMNNIIHFSDLVTLQNIMSWKYGDMILGTAGTGNGKSYFIKNDLYDYCKAHNMTILFLTNRNILKAQFLQEIKTDKKQDVITIMNYQKVETMLMYNVPMEQYDFIVADEIHYIFGDADFNRNTELIIEWLIDINCSVKILLSATSEHIKNYLEVHRKIPLINYSIERNNNHINNVYFYENNDVLMKMLFELPPDEKAIYFGNADKVYQASQDLSDAEFLCSTNSRYSKSSNIDITDQIVESEKFECQVLCTTSVLDNGVSIKDEAVKHVIIDYFDIDTIIQCIGRKRVLYEGDKINIYIRNRSSKSLKMSLTNFNLQIAQVKYLKDYGVEEFVKQYGRKDLSHCINLITDNEGKTNLKRNDIMYIKQLKNIESAELMIASSFDLIVCQKLNIDHDKIKYLENEYDVLTLSDIISQYIGLKMFDEERDDFKRLLMDKLFHTPDASHGSLGMKSINSLFNDNGLDFKVKSKTDNSRKSNNFRKVYWIITDY